MLARTDLPQPALNALLDIDGHKIEADCLWRRQGVIVELDGGSHMGLASPSRKTVNEIVDSRSPGGA